MVDRTHLLHEGEGSLLVSQEYTVGRGNQQQNLVAWLKLLRLGLLVVDLALGSLGFLHMLFNNGSHLVNSPVHLLHILHHHLEWIGLLFPGVLGYIEQTPGSSFKEELKKGEPG